MEQYLAIATAAYTALSIITRITPTKKDDHIMGKIGKFWSLLFEGTVKK